MESRMIYATATRRVRVNAWPLSQSSGGARRAVYAKSATNLNFFERILAGRSITRDRQSAQKLSRELDTAVSNSDHRTSKRRNCLDPKTLCDPRPNSVVRRQFDSGGGPAVTKARTFSVCCLRGGLHHCVRTAKGGGDRRTRQENCR